MSQQTDKFARIDPWRQAELLERAATGVSSLVLSQEYAVHRATVNRMIARYGEEAQKRVRRKKRLARQMSAAIG